MLVERWGGVGRGEVGCSRWPTRESKARRFRTDNVTSCPAKQVGLGATGGWQREPLVGMKMQSIRGLTD